jgi:PAS domain S-box-containing protein
MSDKFSKTVRIDLTAPPDAKASVTSRNKILKSANFSTRQRQADKASAEVRSRYEELLESVYDAAVIASPTGKIIEVNGRAIEFLGYDRETLSSGMAMTDVIDGADENVMRSISETLLTDRFVLLQAFCKRQDGSLFPAEVAVNRLSMDNVRLCFFIRDVTVRYQTEEQLRVEHAAIQICASGIAICTIEGVLDYVNPAFAALVGIVASALPGRDIRSVLPNPEHISPLIDSALTSDQMWISEFSTKTLDGRPLYLQMSASCIFAEDGSPIGIVISVVDFTTHQKIEMENLQYLQDLESLGEVPLDDLHVMQEQLKSRIAILEEQQHRIEMHIKERS